MLPTAKQKKGKNVRKKRDIKAISEIMKSWPAKQVSFLREKLQALDKS